MVQTAGLGDTVFATPLIRALALGLGTRVHVLARPHTGLALEGLPYLEEMIPFDKDRGGAHRGPQGLWSLARGLRGRAFGLVVSLHRSLRSALLVAMTGAPRRVGLKGPFGLVLHDRLPLQRAFIGVQRSLILSLGLPWQGDCLELACRPAEVDQARGLVQGHSPLLALVLGSKRPVKAWPESHSLQLASRLASRGWTVALVGGPQVRGQAQRLAKGPRCLDLTGLPLRQTMALLGLCDAVVGPDTGLVHIARALSRPTVALFGPTPAQAHLPGPQDRFVAAPLPCGPCSPRGPRRCRRGLHGRCMDLLPVDTVELALQSLLAPKKDMDPSGPLTSASGIGNLFRS